MTKNEIYDSKLLERKSTYKRLGNYVTQNVYIAHQCLKCGCVEDKCPKKVLSGVGCKSCAISARTLGSEEYDKKISNSTYIRLEEYISALIEILHKCKVCGSEHKVRPASVLQGHGCKFCTNRVTKDDYAQELSGRPIVATEQYINNRTAIEHNCTICNTFWKATPNNILSKNSGCPKCAASLSTSKGEQELLNFIKKEYKGYVVTNDRTILEGKELDIVLPDRGLTIEYNGIYWHSSSRVDKFYHLNKTKKVESIEYQLIHVFEDEWLLKKDIVKSRLRSLLGTTTKIYARSCLVKEIGFPKEFLEINHIQGCGTPSRINLGLYYAEELVAVMTFGIPRFTPGYSYELIRFCSLLDVTVVGGASKLLKYFRNNYIGSIVTYADRRWSTGKLYETLGFSYSHSSEPNYRYYKGLTSISRYKCQKHLLVANGASSAMSESEIMESRGYLKVFDCGSSVWKMEKDE